MFVYEIRERGMVTWGELEINAAEAFLDAEKDCPQGRQAENATVPCYYSIITCDVNSHKMVPEENFENASATVIFIRGRLSGAALGVRDQLVESNRACIVVQFGIGQREEIAKARLAGWIAGNKWQSLNVAVARDSMCPAPNSSRKCPGCLLEQARGFIQQVLVEMRPESQELKAAA
jgi:hypothetical protein